MLGIIWTILYAAAVAGLSLYGAHRLWMVIAFYRLRSRVEPQPQELDSLPLITIQLPVYNERFVVERLLAAIEAVDYPRERLEIQVLDDSTDDTRELVARQVSRMQNEGWAVVQIHRRNREGFKAGALQNGLKSARGEFIAIFDADFIPPPEILRQSIHHFSDPSIGMVQTRWGHLNREANWLTRVQAIFLDGHLLIEQSVRSGCGRFFNFNGTAGVWRRRAIEEAGGWEGDTLTEDLDLSYRAQCAGWRFRFLPGVVTPAELPATMNAFKTQQHRWAKGAIQTCRKILPRILFSGLPWRVKLEACFHLSSNFSYCLLALMAFLIFPDPKGNPVLAVFLTVHLPVFLLASGTVILFYATVLRVVGIPLRLWVVYLPMLIAFGIGLSINNARAVLEALLKMDSPFTRTPKTGEQSPETSRKKTAYVSPASWLLLIEIVLTFHFARFAYQAIERELWLSLPFFVLFAFSFGYIALLSMGVPRWGESLLGRWKRKEMLTDGI